MADDTLANVPRFDTGSALRPPVRTPDGFVRFDAAFTRTGVFPYRQADGSTVHELRHPDDVFEAASLATLQGKPVTREHPYGARATIEGRQYQHLLDASNVREYQRGMTGEAIRREGNLVVGPITVTDGELVGEVEQGVRVEVSCGYRCDSVLEAGEYQGAPYVRRQRNIRYNHAAITIRGRAGPECAVRVDSLEGGMVQLDTPPLAPGAPGGPGEGPMSTRTLTIRGVPFALPEQAAAALDGERADSLKREQELLAARDQAVARRDALTAELEEKKKEAADTRTKLDSALSPKAVAERVAARTQLLAGARQLMGAKGAEAKLDALTDEQVRAEALAVRRPRLTLATMTPAAIATRFDAELDILLEQGKATPLCGACGATLPEGATTCPACGVAVVPPVAPAPRTDAAEPLTAPASVARGEVPPGTPAPGARTDAREPTYAQRLANAWQSKS